MKTSRLLPVRLPQICAAPALVVSTALWPASGAIAVPAAEAPPTAPVYTSPAELGDGTSAPQPVASSWLVGDLDSGEVFAEHDPEFVSSPASVQKLLTALALVDVLDEGKAEYTATEADVTVDGTKVGMLRDNPYTIDQLFHAMLMSSANDAAHALGEAAGGQDRALELMRDKAAELGMTSTTVGTTSGLDAKGQGTSVRDLFRLAHTFCENDYLMDIVQTTEYTFPGGRDHDRGGEKIPSFKIQDHTKIVGTVDGGIGLKNGFTKNARGSFIAVAERDGRRVAAIVLRSENHARESAIDLLEWSFAQRSPKALETVELEPDPTPSAVTPSPQPSPAQAQVQPSDALGGMMPPALLGAGATIAVGIGAGLTVRKRRRTAQTPRH